MYRLTGSQTYERIGAYGLEDTVSPAVLPDLKVDLSLVFQDRVTE